MEIAKALCDCHSIGFHVQKQKSLITTIRSFPDAKKPYQIFLGSTQSSKLSISDTELASANNELAQLGAQLFVHTPYILNLSNPDAPWAKDLFRKQVEYAVAIGCKGVVIHVGKSVKLPVAEALLNMTANLKEAMQYATAECPILLETPAGQGTETLTNLTEFIEYVLSFQDERIRVCLDTCHVFACGHKPLEAIQQMLGHPGLLKLVHYNDSAVPCGKKVDRHALVGQGHIGLSLMTQIAELCASAKIPMVIE